MGEHEGGPKFPDGGPAFPHYKDQYLLDGKIVDINPQSGMTLRDYFAAKAMIVISDAVLASRNTVDPANFAIGCYELADAMLKERAK